MPTPAPEPSLTAQVAFAVVQLLLRLVGAIAVTLLVAAALTLLGRGSLYDGITAASYMVGGLLLLLALAGHSQTMRVGTLDPWLTSFSVRLLPWLTGRYAGTTLSASAALFLSGLAVVGLGAWLDSR